MIPPVVDTYVYIPFPPPFYLLYLEVIYALTLKIASMGHVTGVFIVPEQRRVTCSVLFYFRLVPEAFKCEPMHRKGKPYHLFSHIFLPPFVYIISITHAGLADPCVIGIFIARGSVYMSWFITRLTMVFKNTRAK